MKKLFCLLLLLRVIVTFSQENGETIEISLEETKNVVTPKPLPLPFTSRSVEKMAILKECESVDNDNKPKQQECLANELQNKILAKFPEFDEVADSLEIGTAITKLQFVLDKNGKIREIITTKGGNEHLSEFVIKLMNEIKNLLEFKPAQVQGNNVDMIFQLPLKYNRNMNSVR